MTARNPEDLDRLFADALNSGNIDALVNLYESQAALMAEPGKVVVGAAAIREALNGFLAGKPRIELTNKVLASAGDVALVSAQWTLSATDADGKPLSMTGRSAEVCRRQPDGSWRFAIDLPWGLEA